MDRVIEHKTAKAVKHSLRLLNDRWVCSGGPRVPGKLGCDFRGETYAAAVTHATDNGATPPDMPRESWTSA